MMKYNHNPNQNHTNNNDNISVATSLDNSFDSMNNSMDGGNNPMNVSALSLTIGIPLYPFISVCF